MRTEPVQNPIPILVRAFIIGGWMAGLVWWERKRALRRVVDSKLRRDARNLAIAGLAALAMQFLEMPVGLGLAKHAQQQHSGLVQRIPLPGFLKSVLAILLLDYTLYL